MPFFNKLKGVLSFSNSGLIAVDLSDNSIEMLELQQTSKTPKIKACARREIPGNLIKAGKIINFNRLASELSGNFKNGKFKHNNCVLAVPDQSVYFTIFKSDKVNKNIKKEILEKAQEQLPIDIKNIYYDFMYKANDEIFFAAVDKNIIEQYIKLFKKAGLNLKSIDIESLCLERCVAGTEPVKNPIVICDIGARTTDIILVDQYGVHNQISLPYAGNKITKTIASALNISKTQAEEIKKEQGLTIEKRNIDNEIKKILDDIIKTIAKVKNNYYRKNNKKIEKIYLAGGTSILKGLIKYFESKLPNTKIEFTNPEPRIDMCGHQFPVNKVLCCNVIGLSLRGLAKKQLKSKINLLKNINN